MGMPRAIATRMMARRSMRGPWRHARARRGTPWREKKGRECHRRRFRAAWQAQAPGRPCSGHLLGRRAHHGAIFTIGLTEAARGVAAYTARTCVSCGGLGLGPEGRGGAPCGSPTVYLPAFFVLSQPRTSDRVGAGVRRGGQRGPGGPQRLGNAAASASETETVRSIRLGKALPGCGGTPWRDDSERKSSRRKWGGGSSG